MRVEVVDPGGGGLALAIGLAQLGHDVVHRGPTSWATAGAGSLSRFSFDLQRRFLRPASAPCGTPDLLVLIDGFGDYLRALRDRVDLRPCAAGDPLRDGAGTLIYPDRLRWFCERATAARDVAIVDVSDDGGEREVAFEALAHAVLFARECAAAGDGPWRPWPFLHNHTLLWLELLRARDEWWTEPGARRVEHDWAFCGTVDHPRYRGRRRDALAELQRRWPARRGVVLTAAPFVDVLRTLQSVRFGVDLPGDGELCFRLHECLALGTPVVRPLPARIAVPRGLDGVLARDPELLQPWPADTVRAVYDASYSPRAAAATFLAGVAAAGTANALART